MEIDRRRDEARSLPSILGMRAETSDNNIVSYTINGRKIILNTVDRDDGWRMLRFSNEAIARGICPKRRQPFGVVKGWEITVSLDGQMMRASSRPVPKGQEEDFVENIWCWKRAGLELLSSKIDFQSVDLVESPVIIPVDELSDRERGGIMVVSFYELWKEFTQRKIKEFFGERQGK